MSALVVTSAHARAITLASLRAARRKESAGGVVFIVAMTIAVLAAVGMYALRAASTELRTSGYERQNAQTHYMTEYGVLAASQEVNATKAQLYIGLMSGAPDAKCLSLAPTSMVVGGVPSSPTLQSKACRRMGAGELTRSWANVQQNTPVLTPYTSATNPGSLGSAPIRGDFFVELTDAAQSSPPAGFDLKLGLCFMQLTVTSVGVTSPIITGNDTALFAGEGLETARARIIAGPVKCPQ